MDRELSDEEWEAVEHLRTSKALDAELAKRRNKGDRFVQVNTKILAKQSADFTNVKEYQLMNYFYDRMGRSNALMVSNKKMAALLNCSTRTVIPINNNRCVKNCSVLSISSGFPSNISINNVCVCRPNLYNADVLFFFEHFGDCDDGSGGAIKQCCHLLIANH